MFDFAANYDPSCVVKEVKIAMYVTTATGFVITPSGDYTRPVTQLSVCGNGVGFSGCGGSTIYSIGAGTNGGNQFGTNCSDFVFDTAATTVFNPQAPPPPPYSGTYQWDPLRNGVGDLWHVSAIKYEFVNTFRHPPDTMLECARIDITTQIVP